MTMSWQTMTKSVMLRHSHTAQSGQIMTNEGSGLVTKEAPFELKFEEPMGSLLIDKLIY
jgi:hypothetical protein